MQNLRLQGKQQQKNKSSTSLKKSGHLEFKIGDFEEIQEVILLCKI